MTSQEVKRKLAAIFSADVKGYSRLMGEDEEWAVHTLNTYKDMMSGLIRQHRERAVSAPGDNVLAEFASVVDSVQSRSRSNSCSGLRMPCCQRIAGWISASALILEMWLKKESIFTRMG